MSPTQITRQTTPALIYLGRLRFLPAAAMRQRPAGVDTGEDELLLVERRLEEAEDDAVDEEVELLLWHGRRACGHWPKRDWRMGAGRGKDNREWPGWP